MKAYTAPVHFQFERANNIIAHINLANGNEPSMASVMDLLEALKDLGYCIKPFHQQGNVNSLDKAIELAKELGRGNDGRKRRS